LPTTFSVDGSTADKVVSPLDSTSSVPPGTDGACLAPIAIVMAPQSTKMDLNVMQPPLSEGCITPIRGCSHAQSALDNQQSAIALISTIWAA
jgi:hypothetical protein